MVPSDKPVTQLLRAWSNGDADALDRLMPIVYGQLRELANRCFRAERPGHTLRATAIVHEAYLRLVDTDVPWQDRIHFFAVSARVMRRILVDHARAHHRAKRDGGANLSLDEGLVLSPEPAPRIVDLHEALERLAAFDPRKSQVIELLYFGGMTYEEAAASLEISAATLHRELKLAKAWLYQEMRIGATR